MELKGWKLSPKRNTRENLLVESELFTGMPQGIGQALVQYKDTHVKVIYKPCVWVGHGFNHQDTEFVGCWVRDDSSQKPIWIKAPPGLWRQSDIESGLGLP